MTARPRMKGMVTRPGEPCPDRLIKKEHNAFLRKVLDNPAFAMHMHVPVKALCVKGCRQDSIIQHGHSHAIPVKNQAEHVIL